MRDRYSEGGEGFPFALWVPLPCPLVPFRGPVGALPLALSCLLSLLGWRWRGLRLACCALPCGPRLVGNVLNVPWRTLLCLIS